MIKIIRFAIAIPFALAGWALMLVADPLTRLAMWIAGIETN